MSSLLAVSFWPGFLGPSGLDIDNGASPLLYAAWPALPPMPVPGVLKSGPHNRPQIVTGLLL